MDPRLVRELVTDYNKDPSGYTDQEAETIATLANALGVDFRRDSKAMSKGLFELADMASFGLMPNEWRPKSRGESVYGETGMEQIIGGVGQIGGAIAGGYGAAKVAGKAFRGARGIAKNAYDKIRNRFGMGPGSPPSTPFTPGRINDPSRLLAGGNYTPQARLGAYGRTGKGARFPINQTTGQPIPMGSGQKLLPGRSGMELPPANFLDYAGQYAGAEMDAALKEIYKRYGLGA